MIFKKGDKVIYTDSLTGKEHPCTIICLSHDNYKRVYEVQRDDLKNYDGTPYWFVVGEEFLRKAEDDANIEPPVSIHEEMIKMESSLEALEFVANFASKRSGYVKAEPLSKIVGSLKKSFIAVKSEVEVDNKFQHCVVTERFDGRLEVEKFGNADDAYCRIADVVIWSDLTEKDLLFAIVNGKKVEYAGCDCNMNVEIKDAETKETVFTGCFKEWAH